MKKRIAQSLLVCLAVGLSFSTLRAHITPMVHLKSHHEAIKMLLPQAHSFFVKKIEIGREELDAIRSLSGWTPDSGVYKFYYGKDSEGASAGSVLFIPADSKHGRLTLAIGFSARGAITGVLITDIPVEPLAWIRKLLQGAFLSRFAGKSVDEAGEVIHTLSKKEVGAMPYYYAEIITRAVERALVLQNVLG